MRHKKRRVKSLSQNVCLMILLSQFRIVDDLMVVGKRTSAVGV
ncbi:hypothetical protein SAMN06265374_3152 [Roseibium denhamense]|uniref:Uncharacterized protein n=1 Tax=Roseibium denhamense TaxID=76305 RepID=A0ABY1P9Y5_9HYPH|nr:hypothetical protein SAMN06265374_3152 [Roseibium denhamense]